MKHKFSLNCEIEFEPNSCDTNPLDEIDTQLTGLILREAISHKLSDLLPRNEYIDIFDTDGNGEIDFKGNRIYFKVKKTYLIENFLL